MYLSEQQKIMLGYFEDVTSMTIEYAKTGSEFTKQLIYSTIDKISKKDDRYKEMLKCGEIV